VLEYTARFDTLDVASMADLELGQAELKAAFDPDGIFNPGRLYPDL